MTTSCGSYQNSSYYDNDGVYGSQRTNTNTENKYSEQNIENSNKYAQQFKSMQDDYTYFTDVDNYNSQENDTVVTVYRNESNNNYAGWGNNSSNVTVNYYTNGWGWNNWYGNYWGWNNWYGPGWGWNNWYGNYWGGTHGMVQDGDGMVIMGLIGAGMDIMVEMLSTTMAEEADLDM